MRDYYLDQMALQHCKFDGPEWQFLSDSQDVQAVKDHCDKIAAEFDAFFVKVEDGDYSEVWGIEGIIPYLYKTAYRIV